MDELISTVAKKLGISEDQARQAVETIGGFIKEKLPPTVAGQVDAILKGQNLNLKGDPIKEVGGLFKDTR